jgi:hypothetical protein
MAAQSWSAISFFRADSWTSMNGGIPFPAAAITFVERAMSFVVHNRGHADQCDTEWAFR